MVNFNFKHVRYLLCDITSKLKLDLKSVFTTSPFLQHVILLSNDRVDQLNRGNGAQAAALVFEKAIR